jgi:hypothetical protein
MNNLQTPHRWILGSLRAPTRVSLTLLALALGSAIGASIINSAANLQSIAGICTTAASQVASEAPFLYANGTFAYVTVGGLNEIKVFRTTGIVAICSKLSRRSTK